MKPKWKTILVVCLALIVAIAVSAGRPAIGQVSSTEVKNPRAKADEQKYMAQLVSIQQSIGSAEFPFTFRLARYLDAKPGQRAALDSNGLEFVVFQDKVVLKVSAFYRVAFNSMEVTQNGRASQTLRQAVLPVLRLVTGQLPQNYDYDAIGFEILYNARDNSGSFDYEGREVLTAVFGRDDAFALARATTDEERQEILNRSDMFVNGKEFMVALGQPDPLDIQTMDRTAAKPSMQRALFMPPKMVRPASSISGDVPPSPSPRSGDLDAVGLQRKLQAEVSSIRDGDEAQTVPYEAAAPSLETSGERRMLHYTMQNSLTFDSAHSSIYKRAAQSFDLFLAPELKDISKRVPFDANVDVLHFSVLNQFGAGKNETLEFLCPIDALRSLVENKITTQELINKSIVLVNGVRIGLDLQLVE